MVEDQLPTQKTDEKKQESVLQIARAAQPRSVRDTALEAIKDAIIHGRLKPGERLIERKLCEATGVSRPSIREVIRQLEADRLVTVTAHRGPAVARLNLKQASDIYELRADLEARLVRAYCKYATDAELAELEAFLSEIDAAAVNQDKHVIVGIMWRFNEHIMSGARLEVTADLLRTLLARISWLRVVSMTAPKRISRSPREIRDIVSAIRRRDPEAAEAATRRYITNAGAAALEQMRQQLDEEETG